MRKAKVKKEDTQGRSTQASRAAERILEMGCGQIKRFAHSTAIDVNPRSVADVIHDLNGTPYPFEDNAFDCIIAEHVLEHLDDLIKIVEEMHRITRPGGTWFIEVPHFSSANFFTDPTHKHAFSSRSFDYFVAGTTLSSYRYSTATLKKKRVALRSDVFPFVRFRGTTRLARAVSRYINRRHNQYYYERHFAFIWPVDAIEFTLEVVKPEVVKP